MLPPMPNRRKATGVERATLLALLLQFLALLWALWHGHRELQSLEVRDAAIEHIVEHVDLELTPTPAGAPAPINHPSVPSSSEEGKRAARGGNSKAKP